MTQEEVDYVFTHYNYLLPKKERLAFAHDTSDTESADMDSWNARVKLYFSNHSIKNDPEIVGFLSYHYEGFIILCAEKLLRDYPDKVFFNRCPKCNALARTPLAKQCRNCGNDWH